MHTKLITELDQMISNFADDLEKRNKDIVLWGTGKFGKTVFQTIKALGKKINIIAFGDNNPSKWGTTFENIPIQGELFFKDDPEKYYVVICSNWENDISAQLNRLNIEYTKESWSILFKSMLMEYYNEYQQKEIFFPHSANFYYFCNKADKLYLNDEVKEKIEKVSDLLHDEHSKELLKQRVDFVLNGDLSLIRDNFSVEQEYFDKRYYNSDHITENEVFVDCGGYIGDTVEDFADIMNECYRKIYVYEPDTSCFQELIDNIKNKSMNNVIPKKCAVGIKNSQTQEADFPTISLDEDIKERVSWIKMDIEGHEMDALKGAQNIIQQYKPKLAICLYHCVEDLYEIPLYLHKLVPEYRFKLGQHFRGHWDFVLYADTYQYV